MTQIDITGADKAEILAALYNASKPLGLGALRYTATPMNKDQAIALLERSTSFDYLEGRVMKIDLSGNVLDARLYNRDNGNGAAERAISSVLSQ